MKRINSKESKAKVIHICDDCGEEINIGETYVRETATSENKLITIKKHKWCAEMRGLLGEFVVDQASNEELLDRAVIYCTDYICTHCENRDSDGVCKVNADMLYECRDRIMERLQRYKLVKHLDGGIFTKEPWFTEAEREINT